MHMPTRSEMGVPFLAAEAGTSDSTNQCDDLIQREPVPVLHEVEARMKKFDVLEIRSGDDALMGTQLRSMSRKQLLDKARAVSVPLRMRASHAHRRKASAKSGGGGGSGGGGSGDGDGDGDDDGGDDQGKENESSILRRARDVRKVDALFGSEPVILVRCGSLVVR